MLGLKKARLTHFVGLIQKQQLKAMTALGTELPFTDVSIQPGGTLTIGR